MESPTILDFLPAQQALAAIEQAFIVSVTDHKGVIRYVNDPFCKISEYGRQELIGKPHRIVKSGIHTKEFFRSMWNTIQRGDVWHGDLCNRTKSGGLYWVDSFIMPLKKEDGTLEGYFSIRYDVTAMKTYEQTALNQADVIARKTRRLNDLAFWIAHEIRPPIANVMGTAEALQQPDLGAQDTKALMDQLSSEAARADHVLRKIILTAIEGDMIDPEKGA